jgi:hypothetical protein
VRVSIDDSDKDWAEPFQITFPSIISKVEVNDLGQIVVTDQDGKTIVFDREIEPISGEVKETVIEDKEGNIYEVKENGAVVQTSKVAPSSPTQIDVSQLDDLEKFVKEVIDSLYSIKVSHRDSVAKIRKADQQTLDNKVDQMAMLESNIEDEELVIETEFSALELIDELEKFDSLVERSVQKMKEIDTILFSLNDELINISSVADEIRKSDGFEQASIIPDRRRRITTFIKDKVKWEDLH